MCTGCTISARCPAAYIIGGAGLLSSKLGKVSSGVAASAWLHGLLCHAPTAEQQPTAVAAMQQPWCIGQPGAFGTHPAVLDAATHTAAALAHTAGKGETALYLLANMLNMHAGTALLRSALDLAAYALGGTGYDTGPAD